MDKLENYRKIVQSLLLEYAGYKPANGDIENEVVFDTAGDHYQLLSIGWEGIHRVFGCIFHIDIKDGKIWVQHDSTDVGIANELVNSGVPKEDIVLAFHAPHRRKHTGFAVA